RGQNLYGVASPTTWVSPRTGPPAVALGIRSPNTGSLYSTQCPSAVQHAHEGRRFFAPAPPPRQNVACEGVGLSGSAFEECCAAAWRPGLISHRQRTTGMSASPSSV